jgi:hypothetical protein
MMVQETCLRLRVEDLTAELDDPVHDLIGGFENNEFLTGGKADDSVRRHFDVFDEIGVDNQRYPIDARKPNHIPVQLAYRHSGRNLEPETPLSVSILRQQSRVRFPEGGP